MVHILLVPTVVLEHCVAIAALLDAALVAAKVPQVRLRLSGLVAAILDPCIIERLSATTPTFAVLRVAWEQNRVVGHFSMGLTRHNLWWQMLDYSWLLVDCLVRNVTRLWFVAVERLWLVTVRFWLAIAGLGLVTVRLWFVVTRLWLAVTVLLMNYNRWMAHWVVVTALWFVVEHGQRMYWWVAVVVIFMVVF